MIKRWRSWTPGGLRYPWSFSCSCSCPSSSTCSCSSFFFLFSFSFPYFPFHCIFFRVYSGFCFLFLFLFIYISLLYLPSFFFFIILIFFREWRLHTISRGSRHIAIFSHPWLVPPSQPLRTSLAPCHQHHHPLFSRDFLCIFFQMLVSKRFLYFCKDYYVFFHKCS